jgi:diadenosine tetraphosphate (Ap4A) HIT family hydrolase
MDHPDSTCPFCIENNLLQGEIIRETPDGYLIENSLHAGNYLIIPKAHITNVQQLPDTWWADVKELIKAVPGLGSDYNVSLNIGELAGQTLPHLHFWVIPRIADSSVPNKGLLGLMEELKQRQES